MNKKGEVNNTFSISKLDANTIGTIRICIVTKNYDPFDKWLPYIHWNGLYFETYPMRTSFECPCDNFEKMKKTLIEKGYIEKLTNKH